LADLFGDLLNEDAVFGTVQGRKEQLFVPTIFNQRRDAFVQSFFTQNNYMEFSMLSNLQISNPRTYFGERYPDGATLDTCFLGGLYVKQVEESILQAMSDGEWLYVPVCRSIKHSTQPNWPLTFLGVVDACMRCSILFGSRWCHLH
jgi:hypothetical protein